MGLTHSKNLSSHPKRQLSHSENLALCAEWSTVRACLLVPKKHTRAIRAGLPRAPFFKWWSFVICALQLSVWATIYLICPEMLFINGKELCALPVCPGFPDIQQPFWNCSFAAVVEYSQVWEKQQLCCTPMEDVSHCTGVWAGTVSLWMVEHTWIACWVTLHMRSRCCLEALSVQQSILRMVYSSSKRKFLNALHTWTSDSFSSSLKLLSGSAPILFWHMSVTVTDTDERGLV